MHEWAGQHEPLRIISEILSTTRSFNKVYHCYGSFGDIYIQISLIKEKYVQETIANPNYSIGVFISPVYQQCVTSAFQGNPNVSVWPINDSVLNHVFNRLNLLGNHNSFPVRLLPTVYPYMPELILSGKLLYMDFMRTLIGSQSVGRIAAVESDVHLNEARKILNESKINIGKTILICPENNTHTEFHEDIWIEVIKSVRNCGWDVCINDSGTKGHNDAKKLKDFGIKNGIKFLKIPPHMPVSMVKLMGSYIGGTNGFVSIQAYFSAEVIGMHLINCLESVDGFIKTPGGVKMDINTLYHCNNSRGCIYDLQIEVPIYTTDDLKLVDQRITSMLQNLENKSKNH
ncbi:MAG: hypothetical protein EBY22_14230 [Gammaproteobacteria bacterium]|nr:hypothetical protein [Gammaproteobacteria bacterium]